MANPVIRATGLAKRFRIAERGYTTIREAIVRSVRRPRRSMQFSDGEFWALNDVNFEVHAGEVLGIIGHNGAGKSTLLRILSRVTSPSRGEVELTGRVGSLLEVGTGFHPELSGRENIFLNGAILGMSRSDVRSRFDRIVDFAGVESFLDVPVKRYSSGMYTRLAFSVAAHLEPDILIVDEVLAVGDMQFQEKCLGRMDEVSRSGRTVLLVSHNMQAVKSLCRRAILLSQGSIEYDGDPVAAVQRYFGSDNGAMMVRSVRAESLPARIAAVSLLDSNGQPCSQINYGDAIEVQVRLDVRVQLEQFNISMAVVHGAGTPAFSEAYSDQHAKKTVPPGEYRLSFNLNTRFLKLEPYSLSLFLVKLGQVVDHVTGIPLPQVMNADADHFLEAQRWGVVRVPVMWSQLRQLEE